MEIQDLVIGNLYEFTCYDCTKSPSDIMAMRSFRYEGPASKELLESMKVQQYRKYVYAFTCTTCKNPNVTSEEFIIKDFYVKR